MTSGNQSAGRSARCSSTAPAAGHGASTAPVSACALRDGATTIGDLIDSYMANYAGRDSTRGQRLAWWAAKIGEVTLSELDGEADRIHVALEDLTMQRGRCWAGVDADGKAIVRAKGKPFAPAAINRYAAALSSVFSWAIKRRLTPKKWSNPCKDIERRSERNEIVRFLSDRERTDLLNECRRSKWPKLYLFVLLALTTSARRGEIETLRWSDVDLDNALATLHRSKNGNRRILPLLPAVVEELRCHAGAPDALIFASRRRPDIAYNHVPAWHAALKDAGVRNFRFHDLRHSCASYLAQSGATLLEIADILGHRHLSVTRRYSHLTTQHKSALANRILGGIK